MNIKINYTPREINLDDLEINERQCYNNSYRISKKYPEIDLVEGIIMIKRKKKIQIISHVWNKKEDVHFDVTKDKFWNKDGKVYKITYFSIKIHTTDNLKDMDKFTFCPEVDQSKIELNLLLKK